MALKLIDQEEAARILGVSTEQINSLRDQRKLFGYRDGEIWKFKQDDVERLREEMKADEASSDSSSSSWQGMSDFESVELEMNDDLDSILLSEVELGDSAQSGPSTVIGKSNRPTSSDDDIKLASGDSAKGESPSEVPLTGGSAILGGSGISGNVPGGSGVTFGSDVKLAGGSDVGGKPSGTGSDKLFGSDALSLTDDELSIVDSGVPLLADSQVGTKKGPSTGSSVKLDEESALSDAGSDVTLRPGDSGIQLISPMDSGISLEEPLALEGSAAGLLADEDVISLDDASDADAGPVKADDEFLLSAIDDAAEDSDSGSQVIALDTDEEISSGIFAPVAGAGMLEEEPAASPLGTPLVAASPALVTSTSGEAGFSGWNVAVLAVCAVFLLLCGMMVYDLLRNMWGWNQPYQVNSSIMDSLASSIGWFDK